MPALSPTGGVAERAQRAQGFRAQGDVGPVHILAHSLGGLDSRYMISKLDMAERVLSLTTLGTPHRGTTFADWGIGTFESPLKPWLDLFGFPTRLSTT